MFLIAAVVLTACNGATLREPYPFYTSIDKVWQRAADKYSACEKGQGEYHLVNCRTQILEKELRKAGYPYMDLAEEYVFTARETAMQVDCGETERAIAKAQTKAAYQTWLVEESKRCNLDNYVKDQREPSWMDMRPLLDKRGFECYGLALEE